MLKELSENKRIDRISVIGHSLGVSPLASSILIAFDSVDLPVWSLQGLHARYLIGRLLEEGVFDDQSKSDGRPAVRPVSFVTLSTPHLGSLQVGNAWRADVTSAAPCHITALLTAAQQPVRLLLTVFRLLHS